MHSDELELRRERLLRILSGATFLIFFQAYMLAPMLPKLAAVFGVSVQMIALTVPAYLIPYGISTLFYGFLSDRIGRRRIMLASLFAFALLTGRSVYLRLNNQPETTEICAWQAGSIGAPPQPQRVPEWA